MNYASLLSDFSEELDTSSLYDVIIPTDIGITIFRTYTGIALYLEGKSIPEAHIARAHVVKHGMYYGLFNIGNKGFKRSYLKVYESHRNHPVYGNYVGWVVHN